MGCFNKYDTDVKVEVIPHDNRTNTTATPPPPISHPLSTIYENYSNDFVFGKLQSSPERGTNLFSLPSSYSSDGSSHKSHQKEYTSMTNIVDDFPMRPPLWEDITSSIQNIDPENAVMLGSIAAHVKLESTEADQMIESLSTSPLLSSLDIKSELKQHIAHSQLASAILPDTSHDHNNRQRLPIQLNPHPSIHPNGNISNNCINSDNNDDNNNSNNHYNTYNLLCGPASVISHYEPNHYDNFEHINNFGDADSHSNIVAMQIHQHIHQHTHIQHSHYHVATVPPSQHHLQHNNNHLYAHNWQSQSLQVSY